MNSYDHAQKGFKTFLVTLTVSLMVFSVLYYFLSNKPSLDIDQPSDKAISKASTYVASASPFEDLANQKINVPKKTVLAGATTADGTADASTATTAQTTASVPSTGAAEVTFALMFSGILLLVGFYVLYLGPRKLALQSFENRFRDF